MDRIVFTGDIMCSGVQNEGILMKYDGMYRYETLFEHISEYFRNAYVCGNLETPISDETPTLEYANFNTPGSFLRSLKINGFSFFSTANNHALDRGKKVMLNTINELDKHSLEHTGTYLNAEDSNNIFIKEIQGCRIALLSFTYGLNTQFHGNILSSDDEFLVDMLNRQIPVHIQSGRKSLKQRIVKLAPEIVYKYYLQLRGVSDKYSGQLDSYPESEIYLPENRKYMERCLQKVRTAKSVSDVVIVCCHVGGQYNNSIGRYTEYITERISNAGADFIVGNHPHCILPYKKIGQCAVFYSLGNFSYTPNYGHYVDGVYSECSIILTMYPSSEYKKIKRITYSVAIIRTDNDNVSRTYLLYDLIQKAKSEEERTLYVNSHNEAIFRFTHSYPSSLEKEYLLL